MRRTFESKVHHVNSTWDQWLRPLQYRIYQDWTCMFLFPVTSQAGPRNPINWEVEPLEWGGVGGCSSLVTPSHLDNFQLVSWYENGQKYLRKCRIREMNGSVPPLPHLWNLSMALGRWNRSRTLRRLHAVCDNIARTAKSPVWTSWRMRPEILATEAWMLYRYTTINRFID